MDWDNFINKYIHKLYGKRKKEIKQNMASPTRKNS